MAHSNLSPFSVDVPAVAYAAFVQADEDMVAAQHSTQAFLDTFAGLGGSIAYMARPNASSTPEHRHIYAVWVRLCLGKAARMLDVDVSEFESVYSGAVKATDRVTIGGETKTATDWKGYVSNAGRVVKQAMQRLVADQLAEAKAELSYAEKARGDAKAEAEAEAAPRGAKAAAKAKAAKLRAKADTLAGEAAAVFDARKMLPNMNGRQWPRSRPRRRGLRRCKRNCQRKVAALACPRLTRKSGRRGLMRC